MNCKLSDLILYPYYMDQQIWSFLYVKRSIGYQRYNPLHLVYYQKIPLMFHPSVGIVNYSWGGCVNLYPPGWGLQNTTWIPMYVDTLIV